MIFAKMKHNRITARNGQLLLGFSREKKCTRRWEPLHGVVRGTHSVSRANGFRVTKQDAPFEEQGWRRKGIHLYAEQVA
jgi:hypothetical protein